MGLSKSTRSELTSSLCRVNAPTIYPADTIVNASKNTIGPVRAVTTTKYKTPNLWL